MRHLVPVLKNHYRQPTRLRKAWLKWEPFEWIQTTQILLGPSHGPRSRRSPSFVGNNLHFLQFSQFLGGPCCHDSRVPVAWQCWAWQENLKEEHMEFVDVYGIGSRQKGGFFFCSQLHGTGFLASVKICFFNSLHIWCAFNTSNKPCPTECINLRHQSRTALSPFLSDHSTVLMLPEDWIYK